MPSTISVEVKPVIGNEFFHLYIVYNNGTEERVIRGGPELPIPELYGDIVLQINRLLSESADARGVESARDRGNVQIALLKGTDADHAWEVLINQAKNIQRQQLAYEDLGEDAQNSNSVVASLLHTIGIDISNYIPFSYYSSEDESLISVGVGRLPGVGNLLDFERDLNGTSANDILVGWNQNDTFGGSSGNDTIDGGAGVDTLSCVGLAEGVDVDMAAGNTVLASGGAIKDVFTRIEAVEGTAYGDRISGDNRVNFLYGLGGADSLYGEAGDDKIYGGDGDDTLNGGGGVDRLEGGAGNDTYVFATGDGADRIVDSDAAGSIVINGATLAGQATYVSGNQWSLAAGGSNYTLSYFDDAQTLTILRNGQTSDTILVERLDATLATLAARNAVFAEHVAHA